MDMAVLEPKSHTIKIVGGYSGANLNIDLKKIHLMGQYCYKCFKVGKCIDKGHESIVRRKNC